MLNGDSNNQWTHRNRTGRRRLQRRKQIDGPGIESVIESHTENDPKQPRISNQLKSAGFPESNTTKRKYIRYTGIQRSRRSPSVSETLS
jgi:hypothetical protein